MGLQQYGAFRKPRLATPMRAVNLPLSVSFSVTPQCLTIAESKFFDVRESFPWLPGIQTDH
jgi:hypothetical protein